MKESRSELMDRYISTVDKLITSDDEIAATIDGLECMILEAKYHINMGRPRRSWLLYHRAIAFGQLLGLHRLSLRRPKQPDAEYYRQLMVWTHLVMGNRYLSVVLGLPYSVAETFVQATITEAAAIAQETAPGEAYLAKMAPLLTKLIDRNQSPVNVPYQVTLQLDNELEDTKRTTPQHWWTTERLPGSSIEEHFDRLQAQFFHYHAKVMLHMPFMLRSSVDKLYQYSHAATLDAAREMIRYFDALRGAENVGPHICKLLDFQAFTAAMLLLLNICGYNSHIRGTLPQQPDLEQDQEDSALIDRTIALLRTAANEPGGVVASQCAKALDMLGKVRTGICGSKEQSECKGESCQIAIPYFGTISIGMGRQFVPIKPGTYPEAGTNKRPISKSQQSYPVAPGGLPTPNSSIHSAQPSPSVRSDGLQASPYENPASAPSGMDNSWTASTEDPFITFDSFMAFPGAQVIDFSTGPDMTHDWPTGNMFGQAQPQHMPDMDQQQAINLYGPQFQEQNMNLEGFPFPPVSGGLELDNGWNWMGVDAPIMH